MGVGTLPGGGGRRVGMLGLGGRYVGGGGISTLGLGVGTFGWGGG